MLPDTAFGRSLWTPALYHAIHLEIQEMAFKSNSDNIANVEIRCLKSIQTYSIEDKLVHLFGTYCTVVAIPVSGAPTSIKNTFAPNQNHPIRSS